MDPPCAISLRRLSRSKPNQQGHDNSHYPLGGYDAARNATRP
jgi:hypothetical protein